MQLSINKLTGCITLLFLWSILAACGQSSPTESPANTTAPTAQPETLTPIPPLPTDTAVPSPTPTATPTPGKLDRYFLTFNPHATAKIPLDRPVGFGLWDNEIPAEPVEGQPQFIAHAPPAGLVPLDDSLLVQAGCDLSSEYYADCSANSTLQSFGCSGIYPAELDFEQQAGLALMGLCGRSTQDDVLTPGDGIFLRGCAFREKMGYLFQTGSGIVLVNDLEDLRQRFASIESEAEAISYAQLATGLVARFELEPSPYLVYLQESIEDTWAEPLDGGYRVNLYHHPYCHCEPYVYSEVGLQIDRDGSITWLSAIPYALTTGFSCAD